jgi:hypothetical protein
MWRFLNVLHPKLVSIVEIVAPSAVEEDRDFMQPVSIHSKRAHHQTTTNNQILLHWHMARTKQLMPSEAYTFNTQNTRLPAMQHTLSS